MYGESYLSVEVGAQKYDMLTAINKSLNRHDKRMYQIWDIQIHLTIVLYKGHITGPF